MKPIARRQSIVMQEVGDELIAYDKKRHHVHRLNRSAAQIWSLCDGSRDVDDLAASLDIATDADSSTKQEVVLLALEQLQEADLLIVDAASVNSISSARATRREFMRGAALAGTVALVPAVISMIAPTPAMAVSGGFGNGTGGNFSTDGGGDNRLGELIAGAGVTGLTLQKISQSDCEKLTADKGGDGGAPCYGPGVSQYFCLPDPKKPGKYTCQPSPV